MNDERQPREDQPPPRNEGGTLPGARDSLPAPARSAAGAARPGAAAAGGSGAGAGALALEERVAGSIRKRGCGFYAAVAAIAILVLVILTTAITGWWYRYNFHAKPFEPVVLSEKEQQVLDEKLDTLGVEAEESHRAPSELGGMRPVAPTPPAGGPADLTERQKDELASRQRRTIVITEKEINAILNHNTDLEERVKIHFHNGGVGGEAIIDIPEDAPFLGGKTVRAKVTVATYLDIDGGLAIIVDDVTVNGVPVPNAWLGDIKGRNLMENYENKDPFLRALGRGIEEIEARNGELRIILAE
jgi:arginine N-succinyltransferase